MTGLEVDLFQGRRRVAHRFVASVGYPEHRVIVRVRGRAPKTGHYTLVVKQGSRTLVRRVSSCVDRTLGGRRDASVRSRNMRSVVRASELSAGASFIDPRHVVEPLYTRFGGGQAWEVRILSTARPR